MNWIEIIGLMLIFTSAGLYLYYPTPTISETLLLSGVWMFALFGGAILVHGIWLGKDEEERGGET